MAQGSEQGSELELELESESEMCTYLPRHTEYSNHLWRHSDQPSHILKMSLTLYSLHNTAIQHSHHSLNMSWSLPRHCLWDHGPARLLSDCQNTCRAQSRLCQSIRSPLEQSRCPRPRSPQYCHYRESWCPWRSAGSKTCNKQHRTYHCRDKTLSMTRPRPRLRRHHNLESRCRHSTQSWWTPMYTCKRKQVRPVTPAGRRCTRSSPHFRIAIVLEPG